MRARRELRRKRLLHASVILLSIQRRRTKGVFAAVFSFLSYIWIELTACSRLGACMRMHIKTTGQSSPSPSSSSCSLSSALLLGKLPHTAPLAISSSSFSLFHPSLSFWNFFFLCFVSSCCSYSVPVVPVEHKQRDETDREAEEEEAIVKIDSKGDTPIPPQRLHWKHTPIHAQKRRETRREAHKRFKPRKRDIR